MNILYLALTLVTGCVSQPSVNQPKPTAQNPKAIEFIDWMEPRPSPSSRIPGHVGDCLFPPCPPGSKPAVTTHPGGVHP